MGQLGDMRMHGAAARNLGEDLKMLAIERSKYDGW